MLERKLSDEEKYNGFFTGLYKQNEMFLLASAAIFFASMFAGYFLSGFVDQLLAGSYQSFKQGVTSGQIKLATFSIFMNNFGVALKVYASGIAFGLGSIFFLSFNGLFIGYAASKFPIGDFIVYTLPHGVFEIAGFIIAGAAGFRLASCVIHIIRDATRIKRYMPIGEQIWQILDVNYWEFKQSFALFAITVVLILIAAFIEANFTIAIGTYLKGVI